MSRLGMCSSLGGDVLISTGNRTGDPPDEQEIRAIKISPETQVLIGSGTNPENIEHLLAIADGVIVASYFKEGGAWQNKVSKIRANHFMDCVRDVREKQN